jgi:hypothetical protein
MPPPSTRTQDRWAQAIAKSPALKERWGQTIPVDASGSPSPDALRDLRLVIQGKPPYTGAPIGAPTEARPRTFPVEPPKPVDWGQRGKDIAKMLGLDIEKLPGMGPDVEPTPGLPEDTGLWSKYVEPVTTGFQAIDEIVAPARGMAFGGWVPGLTKPGVQARSRALREQGFGPWASAGAAYEQATAAGEIPWWQRVPVEMVTDPVELVPGIGLGPAIAKTGVRAATTGVRAATRLPRRYGLGEAAIPTQGPPSTVPTGPLPRATPLSEVVQETSRELQQDVIQQRAKHWEGQFGNKWNQLVPEHLREDIITQPTEAAARFGGMARGGPYDVHTGLPLKYFDDPGYSVQVSLPSHPLNVQIESARGVIGTQTASPLRTIFNNLFAYKYRPPIGMASAEISEKSSVLLDDAARALTQKPIEPVPGAGVPGVEDALADVAVTRNKLGAPLVKGVKGKGAEGGFETEHFRAFYVGKRGQWQIHRKTWDQRSALHQDIEDAWALRGEGYASGRKAWPSIQALDDFGGAAGSSRGGLVLEGLEKTRAISQLQQLENNYIRRFINPVQAGRRFETSVTPESLLPGGGKPLSVYTDADLRRMIRPGKKGLPPKRAQYYKGELARRKTITADKAAVAAKRKEIEDYLGFYDKERGVVVDNLSKLVNNLPEDKAAAVRWFFMPDPEDASRLVMRAARPLSPADGLGYRGIGEESATSAHMNSGALGYGGPPDEGASTWLHEMWPHLVESSANDGLRGSFREIGVSQANIAKRGKDVKAHYAVFQRAIERFFGMGRAHDQFLDHIYDQGSNELAALGAGTRRAGAGMEIPLELNPHKIGVVGVPGALRILYRALHAKDGGQWLEQLRALPDGEGWERQYKNLRSLTQWEENLRKLYLTDLKLLTKEDYFFRGWKAPDDFKQQVAVYEQRQLGQKAASERARVGLTYEEMEAMGFEPLFWHPYKQVMLSSKLGLNHRLQIQLIDMLRKDVNLARPAATKAEHDELVDQGWRVVRGLGPAFDGTRVEGIPVKYAVSKEAEEAAGGFARRLPVQAGGEIVEGVEGGLGAFTAEGLTKQVGKQDVHVDRYMFPKEVADKIENLFGGKRFAAMRKERLSKAIPLIGKWLPKFEYKLDDLVYTPKRAKLFASLFQQQDFAQRAGFGGTGAFLHHVLLGLDLALLKGEGRKGFKEVIASGSHLANLPKHWESMVRANLSPQYRANIKAKLRSTESLYGAEAVKEDPGLAKYTWQAFLQNGLHVNDATILGAEDAVTVFREAVEEAKGLGQLAGITPKAIMDMEYMLRRGLFDGVYPAAIMHDVQYNILPVMRLAHPDLAPDQIMSIIARDANKLWSTVPVEQSVITGNLREIAKRLIFSIGESEGIARTITGMFTGENKLFFATRWGGGFLFLAGVANLIHWSHTGEHLPFKRYIPIDRDWGWWNLGYNQAFLSPDIPVQLSGGENAMLDLVMQQDLMFRLVDRGGNIPLANFVQSRLSVPARTMSNQVFKKDYFGRDIQRWGYTQRMIQFAYDGFAPIGAGQLAVIAAQRAFEGKELPSAGPLLREGATIQDITPTVEARLGEGWTAHALQALGFNIRSKSNTELKDLMAANTFGEDGYDGTNAGFYKDGKGDTHTRWAELKDDPDKKREAYIDPANAAHVEEMERRRALGTRYDQHEDFSKMINEEREAVKERLETEATVVNDFASMIWSPTGKTAWSPGQFRQQLKVLNAKFSAKKEQIQETYGADPALAKKIEERGREPNPGTMRWALWKYYDVLAKNKDRLGNIEYRAFDAAWAKEVAGWDKEAGLEERLDRHLASGEHHPFVQQYYEALRKIEASGYWREDFPTEIASLQRVYRNINIKELWGEYLGASMEQRNALRSKAKPEQRNAIKILELARDTHRLNTIAANPSIDALLVMWMHNRPVLPQNLALWQRLYLNPTTLRR